MVELPAAAVAVFGLGGDVGGPEGAVGGGED